MRKLWIVGLLLLIVTWAAACKGSYPTRPSATPAGAQPTPTASQGEGEAVPTPANTPGATSQPEEGDGEPLPTAVAPCTTTLQLVGLVSARSVATTTQAAEGVLFPLAGIEHEESLESLILRSMGASQSWGTARLALARPVPDAGQPLTPSLEAAVPWVLLAPVGEEETAIAWQEMRLDTPCDGPAVSVVVEHTIAERATFAAEAETQASLLAVEQARSQWTDLPEEEDLWVDALLMEKQDAEGVATWTLYTFAQPPGTPAGVDKKTRLCCHWLHCKTAKGLRAKVCRFYGCRRAMCPQ